MERGSAPFLIDAARSRTTDFIFSGGRHGRIVYYRVGYGCCDGSGDSEKEGSYEAKQRTGGRPAGGDAGKPKTEA